jgi:spermidine/putrescine-binding protein
MKQIYIQVFLLSSFFLILGCGNPPSSNMDASTDASEEAGGGSKKRGKILKILCWEGYADNKFMEPFETKMGIKTNKTYFTSSDDLIKKLTNPESGGYDIITPSPDLAQALVERDLVQPIDLKRITHYDSLANRLRAMQDVIKDSATYGVPFTWGPDYLVYNADVIKTEPKSWNVMFDPKYKGKVSLWDDISSVYLAGILNGDAKVDKAQIYNMNDMQLEAAKKKLLTLKPSIHKFWTSAGELTDLMRSKKVVIAGGWPLTPATLRKEGMNIKGIIPREGATGWIDRLMIPKNAPNKILAEQWIDYITKPENMALVAEVTGYSVSNTNAARYLSPEQLEITQMNNVQYYFDKLNFWQYVRNRKKYIAIWDEIKN